MKYRMYVDEVGNSDLNSSDNPNHRFLSLTGVILKIKDDSRILSSKFDKLKAKYFKEHHPDEPIIFHRKDIVNFKGAFRILKIEDIRSRFDKELLNLLSEIDYVVITICLDKKEHKEKYSTWKYDPYHYCLAMLLERFVAFLEEKEATGDVLAESRGGKEDLRLKDSYKRLYKQGTEFVQAEKFQNFLTSCSLKVKPKNQNIAGLQLCDIIAHSSRNEILREQRLLTKKVHPFGEKIISLLQQKYRSHKGKIEGYGRKFQ